MGEQVAVPGQWLLRLENWTPPSLNKAVGRHWSILERLKEETAIALFAAANTAGVHLVSETHKRRRYVAVYAHYKHTPPDPDNINKILFDAMKRARLIVDDNSEWLDWDRPKLSLMSSLTAQDRELLPITRIIIADIVSGYPHPRPEALEAIVPKNRVRHITSNSETIGYGERVKQKRGR